MKPIHEFLPESFRLLRFGTYSWSHFKSDLIAGITVGIIAIPLAMAFAIASGTTPDRGIFTAIVAGFFISALGGSRVQIGGPTGAFVVIVYDILQRTGYEGLAVSTLLAALILIVFGLFRLGTWIKFISHPLVTGFTTGIAFLIFSSQIKDFFGFQLPELPPSFLGQWTLYFQNFSSFDPTTLLLSSSTLAILLFIRFLSPKVPAAICAIVLATLATTIFHLPVETIQSKFGTLPSYLPLPSLPSFTILETRLHEMIMDAITIALLGGIESLLSALIADGMMGSRHKSNCELVGQGIANIASIFFGGIPATGAIARTATNVKSGATTPMAGMIHAVTIFLAVFFFSSLVSQVPLAALSAVLIMVSWNMSEIGHFIRLFKAPTGDVAVLAATFLLTLFVDITVAILFGTILSSFLFMKKMSEHSQVVASPKQEVSDILPKSVEGIEVYEIQGLFFFGSAAMLQDLLRNLIKPPKVFILRMRDVATIDASGMNALKEFYETCHKKNTILFLSELRGQVATHLKKYGLLDLIEEKHVFHRLDEAFGRACDVVGGR